MKDSEICNYCGCTGSMHTDTSCTLHLDCTISSAPTPPVNIDVDIDIDQTIEDADIDTDVDDGSDAWVDEFFAPLKNNT